MQDKLAFNITTEQGKTLKDAYSEVLRGLGWCFYCSLSSTKSWVFELVWLCLSSLPNFLYLAEVLEHACGMAGLQVGEFASNIPNGIDTYSIREPLGVCAGICSFNFPAMIPLWVSLLCFSFFSSFDFYSSKKKKKLF